MVDKTKTQFSYDLADVRLIEQALGFDDPNNDGVYSRTESENDALWQSFIATLSVEKKSAYLSTLSDYAPGSTLLNSRALVENTTLAALHRDVLRFRYTAWMKDNHLPENIDASLFPVPSGLTPQLFHWVDIDLASFRNNPSLMAKLQSAAQNPLSPAALTLLADFINTAPANSQSLQIARKDWDGAFTQWKTAHPNNLVSATQSWNDMLTMWYYSDPIWHTIHNPANDADPVWHVWMNDTVVRTGSDIANTLGITDRRVDRLRLAQPNMTITAAGCEDFISNPKAATHLSLNFNPANFNPDFKINQATAHLVSTWHDDISEIIVGKKAGVSLKINVAPKAQVLINQKIKADTLAMNVSEPLIRLTGFSIEADAANWFTKLVSSLIDLGHKPWDRTFDPRFKMIGITVYNNRICAVLQGEQDQGNSRVTPVDDDYIIVDLNGLIRPELAAIDKSGALAQTLFTSTGDLAANARVSDIISVVRATVLKDTDIKKASNKTDSLLAQPELNLVNIEARVNNLDADLSGLAKNLLPATGPATLSRFGITNGQIYGRRDLSLDKFFVQGAFDLNLGIHSKVPGLAAASPYPISVEFFADGLKKTHNGKYAGWIKVKLGGPDAEEIILGGDSPLAGSYNGELNLGFTMDDFNNLLSSGDPASLIEKVSTQVLLDLQRNDEDFLVALLSGKPTDAIKEARTLAERLKSFGINYQISANVTQLPLVGILDGSMFIGVDATGIDNNNTAFGLTINNHKAVLSGIANLVADDAILAFYKEKDEYDSQGLLTKAGSYHVNVHLKTGRAGKGSTKAHTENLGGEVIVTPVMEAGRIIRHHYEFKDFSVTIPDAEFLIAGNPEGKTEFDKKDKIARGSISQAKLTGSFDAENLDTQHEASVWDFLDADSLRVDSEKGAGIHLSLENSNLRLFDATTLEEIPDHHITNAGFTLDVMDIAHMSLSPQAIAGHMGATARAENITWDLGLLKLSGDVRYGSADVNGPILPDARFETPRRENGFKTNGSVTVPLATHEPTPEQQESIDTQLHASHAPFAPVPKEEQPFNAKNEIYRNLYEFLKQFSGFAQSIEGFNIEIKDIPILPDADHDGKMCTGKEKIAAEFYPDLKGPLNLLQWAMPLFPEGLMIDSEKTTITASDQHLDEVEIGFKNTLHPEVDYFKWLGMKITGVAIEKPTCPLQDQTASHIYFMKKDGGRVGLSWLLALIKPELVKRMRERLSERYVLPALDESTHANTLSKSDRDALIKNFGDWTIKPERVPRKIRPAFDDVIDFHRTRFANEYAIDKGHELAMSTEYDFVDHRMQQLADDYRFSACEIPDNIADLMSWANEVVELFGVADNLGKKKKLSSTEPSPDFIGTTTTSSIYGNLDLRLRPFTAEAVGTRASVTEENQRHTTAGFQADLAAPQPDGSTAPRMTFDLATREGDLMENIRVISDNFVDFEGELDELHGARLTIDGDPKNGGTFELSVEHMIVRDIGLQYSPGKGQPEFSIMDLTRQTLNASGKSFVDDTGRPANTVMIKDLRVALVRSDDGKYHYETTLKIPDARVSAGYIYVKQEDLKEDGTTKSREIGMNISGSHLEEFSITVKGKKFAWEEKDSEASKGVDIVDMSGTFSLVDRVGLKPGEPRAIIQIGESKSGPEYLFVKDLRVTGIQTYAGGKDAIVNNQVPMGLKGDMSMLLDVPHYADKYLAKAHEQGITANISQIEIDGTLQFDFSGPVGSISRFKLDDGSERPVNLKLLGDIAIHRDGIDLTLNNLVIPIDRFALELIENAAGEQGAALKEFATPAGEAIQANVDGTVRLPDSPLGQRGLVFKEGLFTISSSSGIGVSMTDAKDPTTIRTSAETGIADLHVRLEAGQQVFDIKTGKIFFKDGKGVIHAWEVSAILRDYFYGTILKMKPLLSGNELNLEMK